MVEMTQPGGHRLDIHGVWERLYPLFWGLATVGAWLIWGHLLAALCVKQQWHLDQLYTAVFAFLAITTGFVAAFYCTIVCMSEGFIHQIRNTDVMRGFLIFLKQAIILGFFVSLASIPMMVVEPIPTEQYSLSAFAVALWLGAAVWAIAAFYRVASLFFFMFEAKIEPRRPAG
jgi:hypothetical protein